MLSLKEFYKVIRDSKSGKYISFNSIKEIYNSIKKLKQPVNGILELCSGIESNVTSITLYTLYTVGMLNPSHPNKLSIKFDIFINELPSKHISVWFNNFNRRSIVKIDISNREYKLLRKEIEDNRISYFTKAI